MVRPCKLGHFKCLCDLLEPITPSFQIAGCLTNLASKFAKMTYDLERRGYLLVVFDLLFAKMALTPLLN